MRRGIYLGRNSRSARKIGDTFSLKYLPGEVSGRYSGKLGRIKGEVLFSSSGDEVSRLYLYDRQGRPIGHGPAFLDGSIGFGRIQGHFRSDGRWTIRV